MTPHGFRAMAYDRAEFMAQRRQMMQVWSDYLDTLREGVQVLQFRRTPPASGVWCSNFCSNSTIRVTAQSELLHGMQSDAW